MTNKKYYITLVYNNDVDMKNFESELTLKDVFLEVLFRIPDYQRGYSWDEEQLDDIWGDLENLKHAKEHYTGLITVTNYENREAKWTGFNTKFVIDGQQRLTTIVILLKVIVDRAKTLGMKELGTRPIQDIIQKYLYRENINNPSTRVSILGYNSDDPSYDYLKSMILEIKEHPSAGVQTAYTQRLSYAKQYFQKKVEKFNEANITDLFESITNKLVFNLYTVSSDKEVAMIFESMNNRGKKLSVLELLKNRLMYLSEKLQIKEEERAELREKVKKAWKVMYEWLGKDRVLNDDKFLRAHWIMYYNYKRTNANAFSEELLDDRFSIMEAYSNESGLTYDQISKYVASLSEAVKHWYYMNYPEKGIGVYGVELTNELSRLVRLNKLGYHSLKPLVMAILLDKNEMSEVNLTVKVLKKLEEYIFKTYALAGKPTNTGDSDFYKNANKYFSGELNKREIIDKIDQLIEKHFKIQKFEELAVELFEKSYSGFYSWNYINYFLFEYDLHLKETSRGNKGRAIEWEENTDKMKDYVSVEHIYPQDDNRECWKKVFGKYNEESRNALKNTLGNLLLLSTQRNSSFQNKCFQDKKDDGKGGGYYVGSFSEAEINKLSEWNANNIKERGIRMLEFMEKRWHLSIDNKLALLHINNIQ